MRGLYRDYREVTPIDLRPAVSRQTLHPTCSPLRPCSRGTGAHNVRHARRLVAENLADCVEVNAFHDQPACSGVSERVEGRILNPETLKNSPRVDAEFLTVNAR